VDVEGHGHPCARELGEVEGDGGREVELAERKSGGGAAGRDELGWRNEERREVQRSKQASKRGVGSAMPALEDEADPFASCESDSPGVSERRSARPLGRNEGSRASGTATSV